MKPNLIIFKHPNLDEDGNVQFIQMAFDECGVDSAGRAFTVCEGDAYLDMGYEHITLAFSIPEGSIDVMRFKLSDKSGEMGNTAKIHELSEDELNIVIKELVRSLNLTEPT